MDTENKLAVKELAVGAELGNIYFKFDENAEEPTLYRIVRIQNKDTVSCMINNNKKNIKKMRLEDLRKDFTLLVSNAIVSISKVIAVHTQHGKPIFDIVVMIYKRDDTDSEFTVPDVVCRQATTDVFYEPFCNTEVNPMVGLSVSQTTIPANYTMQDMTICDEIIESLIINTYRTDTLDTILDMANEPKWNETLEELLLDKYDADRRKNPFLPETPPDRLREGYCKSLRLLLETNNFMYDFYELLNITPVTFIINPDNIKTDDGIYTLPQDQKELVQHIYQVNMERTGAIPFDFTVDLESIKVPYVLIMDASGKLYLIMYTRSKDEYVRVYTTTVKSDIDEVHKKLSEAVAFYDKYSKK